MRWWRAMNSPRGQVWARVVLCVAAVIVAVSFFTRDDHREMGWLWVVLAVANGIVAVVKGRALSSRPENQDEPAAQ